MIILYALLLPLCSAIFAAFYSFSQRNIYVGFMSSFTILLSFLCSLLGLFAFAGFNVSIPLGSWIGEMNVNFGILIDNLSLVMMSLVTFVATCVHFYSIFYMQNDECFNKYFAFLGLFVFCMLILVLSDNFLFLFLGWEGVGLCSWLLIGFWYQQKANSKAANEAFIMNRISDFAMLLALFLIYLNFGDFRYEIVFDSLFSQIVNPSVLSLIAALLFIGAMGKSAQFPFHTWLANAMAGPTPVSALLHAATMVTAGVFLLIRANALFMQNINFYVSLVGAFTALFAAILASNSKDLKRIIAFSTLSQLGYMFAACGMGAYNLAFFHLVIHAFFKALLFLGAGNIMHSTNELNIYKMGNLYKSLKITAIFMMIGSLALSGIYPFAGFFSKDKIIDFAFFNSHYIIFAVLLFSAFLTAFYSFRLITLVFFAPSKNDEPSHDASKLALFSMTPLVVLALFGGLLEGFFIKKIEHNYILIAISLIVICSGIILAFIRYKNGANYNELGFLANECKINELYDLVFVKSFFKISKSLANFEENLFRVFFEKPKYIISLLNKIKTKNDSLSLNIIFVASFLGILILIWWCANA